MLAFNDGREVRSQGFWGRVTGLRSGSVDLSAESTPEELRDHFTANAVAHAGRDDSDGESHHHI